MRSLFALVVTYNFLMLLTLGLLVLNAFGYGVALWCGVFSFIGSAVAMTLLVRKAWSSVRRLFWLGRRGILYDNQTFESNSTSSVI